MSVAPLQFLLLVFAGWVNRRQVEILDYLREENREPAHASEDGAPPAVTSTSHARCQDATSARDRAGRAGRCDAALAAFGRGMHSESNSKSTQAI